MGELLGLLEILSSKDLDIDPAGRSSNGLIYYELVTAQSIGFRRMVSIWQRRPVGLHLIDSLLWIVPKSFHRERIYKSFSSRQILHLPP